jgi:multidrug resistance efflux pump
MSALDTLISELKTTLSPKARDELDRIARLPEAEALFSGDAEETRRERIARRAVIASLPAKYDAKEAAAGRQCEEAAAKVDATRTALREAEANLQEARRTGEAVRLGRFNELTEAERTLRETADARLGEFDSALSDLDEMTRHATAWGIIPTREWLTGQRGVERWTNAERIETVRAAIKATRASVSEAQMQMLEKLEVTEMINGWLRNLEPMLAPMNLNLLGLDEFGNLTRDRSRRRSDIIDDAVRANGGKVESAAPPAAPAPRIHTGTPRIRAMKAQLDGLSAS